MTLSWLGMEGWSNAIYFVMLLDGKNIFLFFQCGSDCHLCIQNSCVHQLIDWCRGVRDLNGILFSKVVHI